MLHHVVRSLRLVDSDRESQHLTTEVNISTIVAVYNVPLRSNFTVTCEAGVAGGYFSFTKLREIR